MYYLNCSPVETIGKSIKREKRYVTPDFARQLLKNKNHEHAVSLFTEEENH